ncbi:MAG: CRISPR-associated endonuclease Cas1 [Chloroflexi bacterium]|nr:CRISPR-associated endonuclease Cas1 [Chloroflexota bacterium]
MSDDGFAAVPDTVPARMVNEYAYCPRLVWLEWVQGDFQDSADTVEGRFRHRVVDKPGGALPKRQEDEKDEEDEEERIHARSVWLSAEEERLNARMDLIEGIGGVVSPVDYKRGSAPDLPQGAWESDRVQLCAQALVLRANGYVCDEGVLYYAESRTRVVISIDEALVARTREIVSAVREMAASGRMPPPLVDSPKCVRCSLAPICLPDETNLLTVHSAASVEEEVQTVRRLMPARDDAAPLYVREPGARVSKSGEMLQVWLKDEKLAEARLFEISHIALFGASQITTPALNEALERGISVAFFSMGGWFKGMASGPMHKNVVLRMAQYRAAFDSAQSLALARAFTEAKIRNCRVLLMRNHADLPPAAAEELRAQAKAALAAPDLPRLLSIEGNAARTYFGLFSGMLKPRSRADDTDGWVFNFDGRNRRPPRDPVNALLSFAYAMLAKELTVAAQIIGFDPYLGFYHQPRYGRPSLALDVMEEFRPLIADSVVLSVINTGILGPDDFVVAGESCALTPGGRKKFIQAFEVRMDSEVTHPIFRYRISYRRVLEVQLRLLGRVLSGEIAEYPAFVTR